MDMSDPRLQLSDLTDYQYQTSLAQQYHTFNPNGTATNHVGGFFDTLPQNGSRPSTLTPHHQLRTVQSQRPVARNQLSSHDFGLQALYQQVPVSGINRESNVASQASSRANLSTFNNGHSNLPSTNTTSGHITGSSVATRPPNPSPQDVREIKDPNVFVPPHLLAPMKPNPPGLKQWREKFFNIDEPLVLTSEEYLTYFPHIDNVYSHRSTQKYKKKPFVSHYWDCRLKGRPTGTPMNKNKKADVNGTEGETKKRKRKIRERDLCDVKIKVTEYFGTEELEALKKLGLGPDSNNNANDNDDLNFVLDGHQTRNDLNDATFGVLEPAQQYPPGHPGAGGEKWYLVQRVHGNDRDGNETDVHDLDHKHTLEESDMIKKNSVQRWLLSQAKEKKKAEKSDPRSGQNGADSGNDNGTSRTGQDSPPSRLHATGVALQTLQSHADPAENHLTFYGCSYCPFAQRAWIALEMTGIPYRYVEVLEKHFTTSDDSLTGMRANFPELDDINPQGRVPCIKHNNFAVWDSKIMMEYLEDLGTGQSLFAPAEGNPQFKAHSRLWVDFIDQRILPVFYALLLLPNDTTTTSTNSHLAMHNDTFLPNPNLNQCDPSTLLPNTHSQQDSRAASLIALLHKNITTLVNASHLTGPFFLGPTLSYVDIAFAPWIIRLSRVLSPYRGFPRPEVGTRWRAWSVAIELNEVVRRTVSEDASYGIVYGGEMYGTNVNQGADGVNSSGWHFDQRGNIDWDDALSRGVAFPEIRIAKMLVEMGGFGAGGKGWTKLLGKAGTVGGFDGVATVPR